MLYKAESMKNLTVRQKAVSHALSQMYGPRGPKMTLGGSKMANVAGKSLTILGGLFAMVDAKLVGEKVKDALDKDDLKTAKYEGVTGTASIFGQMGGTSVGISVGTFIAVTVLGIAAVSTGGLILIGLAAVAGNVGVGWAAETIAGNIVDSDEYARRQAAEEAQEKAKKALKKRLGD